MCKFHWMNVYSFNNSDLRKMRYHNCRVFLFSTNLGVRSVTWSVIWTVYRLVWVICCCSWMIGHCDCQMNLPCLHPLEGQPQIMSFSILIIIDLNTTEPDISMTTLFQSFKIHVLSDMGRETTWMKKWLQNNEMKRELERGRERDEPKIVITEAIFVEYLQQQQIWKFPARNWQLKFLVPLWVQCFPYNFCWKLLGW